MAREHSTTRNLVRRLRPAPERFAAAAAMQDPNLLLQLQAAKLSSGRRITPPHRYRPAASSPCLTR